MPPLKIGPLRAVSRQLNEAGLRYAFTGGAIVNLLLDDPEFAPARPTDDVDVIVEVVSGTRYDRVEAVLRECGFEHDMSEDAPMCRWKLDGLTVDVMPTDGSRMGLNTR